MEKTRTTCKAALTAGFLLTVIALTALHADAVSEMLNSRIKLCLTTLIPSLYGCMVLAELLTESGAAAWAGARLRGLARLLHISPEVMTIFFISQIAGYPVGAMLLQQQAERGRLSHADAARLSYACFGGGPAFLIGFAGVQMFGSAAAGRWMMTACIVSNLVLLILLGRKMPPAGETAAVTVRLSPFLLTESVRRAMRSMAGICGMVLLFGAVMQLCETLGLLGAAVHFGEMLGIAPQTCRALLNAAADVTQLPQLMPCGLSFRHLYALTGGLLSFGGLCVHFQCAALGGGHLPIGKLLLMRLFAGLLTALMLYFAAELMPFPAQTAVFSVQHKVSASGSPLPALLIFCTGFPFLLKKD